MLVLHVLHVLLELLVLIVRMMVLQIVMMVEVAVVVVVLSCECVLVERWGWGQECCACCAGPVSMKENVKGTLSMCV